MPFSCPRCESETQPGRSVCPDCASFISYRSDDRETLATAVTGDGTDALPDYGTNVSMGEGDTPLASLSQPVNVVAKLESLNPTCSFKDRGSALTVGAVLYSETPYEAVVVASTGNTATSVAAYAARADVPCAVLVPEGTGTAKLSQAAAHDAHVFSVEGTFSDCFELARTVAEDDRIVNATAVYSANSFLVAANRSVAFELVQQCSDVPDWISVPVGAGPLLGGTYAGFQELERAGVIETTPRMLCVQSRGCHPVVRAIERGEQVQSWDGPINTRVGAIADPLRGYAADGERTRQAVLESDGTGIALDDETVFDWQSQLASEAGIYAEPASAASVAGIAECDAVDENDLAVALVTGHGLKEPVESTVTAEPAASPETIRSVLLP